MDPIEAPRVAVLLGQHDKQTSDAVGNVIMRARCVVDAVAATARGAPFERTQLGDQAWMIQQIGAA